MNNIHEVIKTRALAALRADKLPTDQWALKNRVGVTVLAVSTELFKECVDVRLTKTDHKSIHRDIMKELAHANH
ncbi:hypothetical protein LRP30_19760 [Bradyrhizobium sp. C-145]|uniref:hypothetical protein n=1 Tax=Bradyrhizobium sp. C-145 TaxID=574727 RepID=UPI00201B97E6|nr:hypothetical protein [Bradyrhizobium sp. C-145]UQR67359.1 hypothetical protein LRP30_19760 [Bradyrhizobium sp. C-145]